MNAPLPPTAKAGPDRTSAPLVWRQVVDGQKREARRIVGELVAMRGVMPLLMKHRNGGTWSDEERAELLRQLRRLSRLSPYLLLLLLPGSALLLPAYAWWLDRRRGQRPGDGNTP